MRWRPGPRWRRVGPCVASRRDGSSGGYLRLLYGRHRHGGGLGGSGGSGRCGSARGALRREPCCRGALPHHPNVRRGWRRKPRRLHVDARGTPWPKLGAFDGPWTTCRSGYAASAQNCTPTLGWQCSGEGGGGGSGRCQRGPLALLWGSGPARGRRERGAVGGGLGPPRNWGANVLNSCLWAPAGTAARRAGGFFSGRGYEPAPILRPLRRIQGFAWGCLPRAPRRTTLRSAACWRGTAVRPRSNIALVGVCDFRHRYGRDDMTHRRNRGDRAHAWTVPTGEAPGVALPFATGRLPSGTWC